MWQDFRFAFRTLAKTRAFSALCVAMLALGIGGDTTAFSILDGALFRALPYRDPGRLLDVLDESRRESRLSKLFDSVADFREYRIHARAFEEVAAITWAYPPAILSSRGPARQVTAFPVSDNFFRTLGVAPALGRDFSRNDEGGCVVMLSHAAWSEWFAADRGIAGQRLTLDRQACEVAGVMPAGFTFYPAAAQMWRILPPDAAAPVFIVGRLRPGVSPQAAQAELAGLHSGMAHASALEREFSPAASLLQDDFTWLAGRNLRSTLWVLMAAVSLVLLIACLNIANLLLGRSLARSREMAVRLALGGGRGRLVRLLLAEGLVLGACGGMFGVALAFAAVGAFRTANPIELPAGAAVSVNLTALAFALAVSIVTALLFALAPAWRSTRVDLNEALKEGGRSGVVGGGRSAMARALVGAEMALSLILLAGAGLFLESVLHMGREPLGFDPAGVSYAGLALPHDRYSDPAMRLRLFEQLAARIDAREVAVGSATPPFYSGNYALDVFGRSIPPGAAVHDITQLSIDPEYLRTLRIRLLRGRSFDPHDRLDSEPVAIVNEALAREYFPSMDPLGQRARIRNSSKPGKWATIVGVVGPVKSTSVYREMGWSDSPTVYFPLAQQPPEAAVLVIRGAAPGLRRGIEDALRGLDADAAIGSFDAAETGLSRLLAFPRFRAVVLACFAAFALVLAATGLYAVLSQLVLRRTDEIAIRVALGAQPSDIARMIGREAAVPVLGGLTAGLAVVIAAGRFVSVLLYGVGARDPILLAGASAALLATAAAATLRPARRAARQGF